MASRVRLPLRTTDLIRFESDRSLLDRFISDQDGEAFKALVRRHGPMVLGICQRMLRDVHLAEDAFQATFVVLARRPDAVRRSASLASWLFGVARRVSLAARRRQRRMENVTLTPPAEPTTSPHSDFDDLLRVLDDELARLPDELRAPLIACYLDEQTQDDAARNLGWSLSTLRRRLERGKSLLRSRLSSRGVALGSGLFAVCLAPTARAAVPEALLTAACGKGATPAITALAAAGLRRSLLSPVLGLASLVIVLAGGIVLAATNMRPQPSISEPAPETFTETAWAHLRGRVTFPGHRAVPQTRFVETIDKDAEFIRAHGPVTFEDVLIHPANRGVKNVVVWLRPDDDDPRVSFAKEHIPPSLRDSAPTMRRIEIGCCQFQPRVVAARAGDTLRFVNRAAIPHTVRYEGSDAGDFSVLLPANSGIDAPIPLASRHAAGNFSCTIHPWMRGSVRVFDHPYFAVTDENGMWEMPQAPKGRYRLVYWHESAGYHGDRRGQVLMIPGDTTLPTVEFDVTVR